MDGRNHKFGDSPSKNGYNPSKHELICPKKWVGSGKIVWSWGQPVKIQPILRITRVLVLKKHKKIKIKHYTINPILDYTLYQCKYPFYN